MPSRSLLALPLTGLVTLGLAAFGPFACSSTPEGGNGTLPNFNNQPGGPATDANGNPIVDANGNPATVGDDGIARDADGNPITDANGNPITVNEGNVDPNLNGAGGSANTGGGAGAGNQGTAGAEMPDGPVVDIVAEPGPGFFTSGDWRGYAWTAIETDPVQAPGTSRTPLDYTELPLGDPFCLSGTVAADPPSTPTNSNNDGYQGFAMLGFNIAQPGVPEVEGAEPTVGTTVPTANGIALTFSQNVASALRLQIQGLNADDATQRWCGDIPPADAQGRSFVPYTALTQECYLPAAQRGPSYQASGRPPLAAVSFIVPGEAMARIPFDFCIAGIADGNSEADAPTPEDFNGGGLVSGSLAQQFARQRVRGTDGNLYVVQNNAWNTNATNPNHRIQFEGNSFTVVQQGNGGDGQIPISFPSIFVGGNGNQGAAGDFSTAMTDGLPRRINEISAIPSTFNTNAGQLGGAFNATYDIWFHANPPQGAYEDAGAAFLMVWTHKPGQNPIGLNPFATNLTIAGAPGTWDLWIGPRNENGREQNLNGNAPVISYVSRGGQPNFSANLMLFINDAVQRSNNGQLRGFQFPANLVLTDIFAGFEIWNGGQGLRVSEFTVDVQ